jgi:hypothetical protein
MKTRWLVLCAALALAACSDGPDALAPEPPVAADEVPASATASPEAYTDFVAGLAPNEDREPLQVNGVVPPTSETAAPAAVL